MSTAQTNLNLNHFQLSPSLAPVLPRLQGDGMDSEKLRLSPSPPSSSSSSAPPPPSRHRKNLQPEPSTTYLKQPGRSTVPREPVKAAVKAVEAGSGGGGMMKSAGSKGVGGVAGKTVTFGGIIGKDVNGSSTGKKQQQQPQKSLTQKSLQAPKQNSSPSPLSPKAQLLPAVYSHKEECTMVPIEEPEQEEEHEEERSVEGSTDSQLAQQLVNLSEELDVQLKVNADLKKLLVASVGDDLHHKVEAIVRTRAQLATDMTQIDKQRKEEYEDLDHITIQADMWRSKYTASRLLVDNLRVEKAAAEEEKQRCMTAVQQLMAERHQLSEDLIHTHRYIKLLRDAFDVRPGSALGAVVTVPNVLELARTLLRLASAAKARLLPTTVLLPAALDQGVVPLGLSPAERLAQQVLSGGECTVRQSAATTAAALNYYRFHPSVRYDNITFDCCRKCKGDIQIV